MAVVRVRPRVALIDDEVDVDDVQRLAEPFEQVEGVGVAADQQVAQPEIRRWRLSVLRCDPKQREHVVDDEGEPGYEAAAVLLVRLLLQHGVVVAHAFRHRQPDGGAVTS